MKSTFSSLVVCFFVMENVLLFIDTRHLLKLVFCAAFGTKESVVVGEGRGNSIGAWNCQLPIASALQVICFVHLVNLFISDPWFLIFAFGYTCFQFYIPICCFLKVPLYVHESSLVATSLEIVLQKMHISLWYPCFVEIPSPLDTPMLIPLVDISSLLL